MSFAFILSLSCLVGQGLLAASETHDVQNDLGRGHKSDLDRERRLATTTIAPANVTVKQVCYDLVGCFNNSSPFTNDDGKLPEAPTSVKTKFRLYKRGNSTYQLLTYFQNDTSVTNSAFNSNLMTRVIVHGYQNTGDQDWVMAMKDAFLKVADQNIIVVDWGHGAGGGYGPAVANTRLVGAQLHLLLQRLVREAGLKLDSLHLIGHSLGAHISGYAGRRLHGQIGRITGMDPAGPDFQGYRPAVILDKTDAQFVDNIHTNGKTIIEGGAGMSSPTAHVDFYVNGGRTQPGCKDGLSGLFNGGFGGVSCSHGRSHQYFLESLTSECSFTAYPCHNYSMFQAGQCLDCEPSGCSEMGLYADQHKARGMMFLKTLSQTPFCGFHYAMTIHAGRGQDTKGTLSVKMAGTWGSSGLTKVTEEEEDLKSGVAYVGVFVSPVEVGSLKSLTVRYEKSPGRTFLHFGRGQDIYPVLSVDVTSGESGKT
ncbi:hypothetical protein BaRGS_00016779, partial [Batillaria attramentaria]